MPTRVVLDGVDVPGDATQSVRERRDRFAAARDDVRRFLVCEPRGHADMFAAVPVAPSDPAADLGVFFMDAAGYLDMCGHATIGAVTALADADRLAPGDAVLETPAGLVRTTATAAEDGGVESVTFENVPAAYCGTRTVRLPSGEAVTVDLVSAGNVCAILPARALDLSFDDPVDALGDAALAVRDAVAAAGPVRDPVSGSERPVSLAQLTATDPNRTLVVFGDGSIDRSPCGTGTCARMTLAHHEGTLAVGDAFRHAGPTGESFTGRVLDADDGDDATIVRTAVTGRAHVTGRHTFVRTADDDLDGFTIP